MITRTAVFLGALTLAGTAQAALHDRGGGLIYDDDLNVTWLQDANYAQTSGYDADGLMTWNEAVQWAANLSYFDSVRNVTYTDWRLPTTTDTGAPGAQCTYGGTDCGYNVDPASSEMAHLFFSEQGNLSAHAPSGSARSGLAGVDWGLVNKAPFSNIRTNYYYWSATEYAPSANNSAWQFDFYHGYQLYDFKPYRNYAWAVRDGDVIAASIPEPETYGMFLAGLGLLAFKLRKKIYCL